MPRRARPTGPSHPKLPPSSLEADLLLKGVLESRPPSNLLKNYRFGRDFVIQGYVANLEDRMRSTFEDQGGMFSYISPDARGCRKTPASRDPRVAA